MSYAEKFNKGSKFNFKMGEGVIYTSLAELFNENESASYEVKALYINKKSKFGDAPCTAIDEKIIVNLPNHLLDTVCEMINDDECVEAINNGEVYFKIYSYVDDKFNKTCYGVKWL